MLEGAGEDAALAAILCNRSVAYLKATLFRERVHEKSMKGAPFVRRLPSSHLFVAYLKLQARPARLGSDWCGEGGGAWWGQGALPPRGGAFLHSALRGGSRGVQSCAGERGEQLRRFDSPFFRLLAGTICRACGDRIAPAQ